MRKHGRRSYQWEVRADLGEPALSSFQRPGGSSLAQQAGSAYDGVMRYEQTTQGIRVSVRPSFSLSHSELDEGRFVFTYLVEMENQGNEAATLLFRHWRIHDAVGVDSEVDGEGVVGEQPTLKPGNSHEYQSFCVLGSPAGFMEGYYTFVRPDGQEFEVSIPRFDLEAPFPGGLPEDPDGIN